MAWRDDDPGERMQHAARTRVLFLHPNDELYGSDRVLLNLVRGLDASRFEPYVVVGDDLGSAGLLTAELRKSAIPVFQLPLACVRRRYLTPRGLVWFTRRLRRSVWLVADLIESQRIDVVYTNTLAVWTGALAAARTHRAHLWHAHEIVEHPAVLRVFLRRFVPHYAQRVVCVSRATADHLLVSRRARAKGIVLYNGIAPKEWLAASGRGRIRAELGCADDDVLIGMIGRISRFKAPDVFVEAASLLLARHPHLRFFIAGAPIPGETTMRERVARLIAQSPAPERIHLLGFREDVPDLTAALDILVVPSRLPEPFPLVNLQAMFAARPIVGADRGAMREAILDGETGLVVASDNAPALAGALSSLVGDPARRAAMGAAGRRRALDNFTLEQQLARFNDLLWRECGAPTERQSSPIHARAPLVEHPS